MVRTPASVAEGVLHDRRIDWFGAQGGRTRRGQLVHDVGADDEWRDLYRAIALRYVPEPFADAYLNDTHDEPRGLWALDLAAARIETWRMPTADGEDPLAVWAPKYYHR
jgi:hypothetical protein